jgi:acetolactate synthase I/II/III large subunit
MGEYNGAEAFIDVLNANGVDKIFFNAGGEQAELLATITRFRLEGKAAPQLVACLDESVALAAAHGHYMVSSQPQLVMVHAELGTLQLGGALHNVQGGRVPVILWAGLMNAPLRANWKKEPYDQGMIVRNCVKWDHQISQDENVRDVLQQAFQIALTEPCGPVYLCYPRDIFSQKMEKIALPQTEGASIFKTSPLDMNVLNKAAQILIKANSPLLVAGYTGRHPETIPLLAELAETLSAPVLGSYVWMNFPTTHPLCAGIEQIGGSRKENPYIADSDVILAIDYDLPYVPAHGMPKPGAKIIHIDVDPLSQGRPLWGRGADIYVEADSREAIAALTGLIQQNLTPQRSTQIAERSKRLAAKHMQERAEWRVRAKSKADQKPISADWLGYCLAQIIDDDTIFLHHSISHSASATEQIDRTKPGTLLGCSAGSIQWALGAALGAKVAAPDKTVVSLMTDGGFVWGCPVSTFWSSVAYQAPFLAVVLNNQSYSFIKLIVEKVFWDGGEMSNKAGFEAGLNITPSANYGKVAEACGGWGRRVEDPADVLPTLKEAMAAVRQGIPAVVDVMVERGADALL